MLFTRVLLLKMRLETRASASSKQAYAVESMMNRGLGLTLKKGFSGESPYEKLRSDNLVKRNSEGEARGEWMNQQRMKDGVEGRVSQETIENQSWGDPRSSITITPRH